MKQSSSYQLAEARARLRALEFLTTQAVTVMLISTKDAKGFSETMRGQFTELEKRLPPAEAAAVRVAYESYLGVATESADAFLSGQPAPKSLLQRLTGK